MISDKEIFANFLRKILKLEGVVKGKILAGRIGVHPSTISGWIGDKTKGPGKDISIEICNILNKEYGLNVNYDNIIQQGRSRESNTDNMIYFKDSLEREHFKVIQTFINQKKAIEINSLLSELEKMDIEEFFSIAGKIEGKVNKLRNILQNQTQPKKELNQSVALGEEKKNA